MPALDQCHEQIANSLRKAGWKVDDKPYVIRLISGRRFFIDIQAQRDQNEIIVVEIKCFADNQINELYTGIGQYLVYRSLLERKGISRSLYLAILSTAYIQIVQELAMDIIVAEKIKLIVVDVDQEVVEQWLE
jgi:hypothetical protein